MEEEKCAGRRHFSDIPTLRPLSSRPEGTTSEYRIIHNFDEALSGRLIRQQRGLDQPSNELALSSVRDHF